MICGEIVVDAGQYNIRQKIDTYLDLHIPLVHSSPRYQTYRRSRCRFLGQQLNSVRPVLTFRLQDCMSRNAIDDFFAQDGFHHDRAGVFHPGARGVGRREYTTTDLPRHFCACRRSRASGSGGCNANMPASVPKMRLERLVGHLAEHLR